MYGPICFGIWDNNRSICNIPEAKKLQHFDPCAVMQTAPLCIQRGAKVKHLALPLLITAPFKRLKPGCSTEERCWPTYRCGSQPKPHMSDYLSPQSRRVRNAAWHNLSHYEMKERFTWEVGGATADSPDHCATIYGERGRLGDALRSIWEA